MASTPAPLPSLGLLDGLGAAAVGQSPGPLPHLGLLGGLGSSGPTYTLTAEHGTVTVSGSSALSDYAITFGHGTVSLSGQDASFTLNPAAPDYTLTAEHGTVSLSGQAVAFLRGYRLEAEAGVVSVGGQDVGLNRALDERSRPVGAASIYHARVGDKIVRGSRQQIEALLRQMAQEHAEEDEERIENAEPPKKRAVRVVAPGKVNVQPAKTPSVTVALPLMASAGITQTQAADVYARAYEQHMRRQEIKDDDDDVQSVVEHVRKHRASLGAALAKHIEALKDLL